MTHSMTKRGRAAGPAVGVTGAALGGAISSFSITPGRYVGAISVRLRTRLLSVPIQSGSVLVQVALGPGGRLEAAPAEADSIEGRPFDWAQSAFVRTGQGAIWHPNLWINEGELSHVYVRVWNRDDLDSTSPIQVDVAITTSLEPIVGSDTPPPTYAPGTGTMRRIASADPAAGAEVSVTTPAGLRRDLVGFEVVLVTSATAASRTVTLTTQTSAGLVRQRWLTGVNQAASQTVAHLFANGGELASLAFGVGMSMGRGQMRNDEIMATVTTNLQVGDNYGVGVFAVEEWVSPGVPAS